MGRLVFGGRTNRPLEYLDDLLGLMLDELFGRPSVVLESRDFLGQHGRPMRGPGISEQHQTRMANERGQSPSIPCSCCGMRFSANLMKDGICHNCRSQSEAHQDRKPNDQGVCAPSTLKQAYQVLGCAEQDTDQTIKKRHRELAKEFHSDRLSQEVSPQATHNANIRFCLAQEAYEIVMIARKKAS
jgi:DnaJ-domain-containing protein 1